MNNKIYFKNQNGQPTQIKVADIVGVYADDSATRVTTKDKTHILMASFDHVIRAMTEEAQNTSSLRFKCYNEGELVLFKFTDISLLEDSGNPPLEHVASNGFRIIVNAGDDIQINAENRTIQWSNDVENILNAMCYIELDSTYDAQTLVNDIIVALREFAEQTRTFHRSPYTTWEV